ncbi:hypothetical protein CEXT_132121 [Caerostris extrusa]|uniref:Uncharacterized protein n=1 Tax=Caerostris extrusa TaxID=172846 RepID=A0AAV4WFI5_CAEEX|nr:hypothetical protein CEXT_132121 [Caerostris extrusa]
MGDDECYRKEKYPPPVRIHNKSPPAKIKWDQGLCPKKRFSGFLVYGDFVQNWAPAVPSQGCGFLLKWFSMEDFES